jgi:hypothetical protein
VLRIGGDSSDTTWWPVNGVIPPGGVNYSLTEGWLRTTRALADALGAQLILGVNLAGSRPALAAAEARAFLRGIGRKRIAGLEIGNEPDVYNVFPWYRDRRGRAYYARAPDYDLRAFTRDFSRFARALPAAPLVGPAFAELTWLSGLGRFIAAEPGLRVVTVHRYPLRAGVQDPTSTIYPSIENLLSDRASSGLAQSLSPFASIAHARGLQFRVDEINSAAHFGQPGVSDSFASALWALDTLFNLASVGVDGVNLHSLPGARYELFTFKHTHRVWSAFVHPEYYGLLMFAQAFPPTSRLLPVQVPAGPVKVWATHSPDGTLHVVLINKDPSASHLVDLHLPDNSGSATIEWLLAPSAGATRGVTLGGQTFGSQTDTGAFPAAPRSQSVYPLLGGYSIQLPPASAALLTR